MLHKRPGGGIAIGHCGWSWNGHGWWMELEMLDVVVKGMSRVVDTERLVQCVAVAAVLSVVLVRWAVAVVWHVSMAKDTA